MDEVEAIKAVKEALDGLEGPERARVLGWAQAKYGAAAPLSAAVQHDAPLNGGANATPDDRWSVPAASATRPKSSKKAKTVISMDKSLNLSPAGKQSALEFAKAKAPGNVLQKCVVAAYYLRETLQLEKVNTQSVFTFFKFVSWVVPADLKNTLQQAGTKGWLDTADGDDIKITSMGENVVEHKLPPKAPSSK